MIAQNLKKIRQELNLSVAKFAEKIDMSANTLTNYERNERTPNAILFVQLSNKLNINLNWLISGQGSMFINTCENTHALIKNKKHISSFKGWGKRLGKILTENNETPYSFAKRTGIKENRIEKFILDSAEPTMDEINAIKSNVDISIDELFYGETISNEAQTENISLSSDEILKLKKFLNQSNI